MKAIHLILLAYGKAIFGGCRGHRGHRHGNVNNMNMNTSSYGTSAILPVVAVGGLGLLGLAFLIKKNQSKLLYSKVVQVLSKTYCRS